MYNYKELQISVTLSEDEYHLILHDIELFKSEHLDLKLNTIFNIITSNYCGKSTADYHYTDGMTQTEIERMEDFFKKMNKPVHGKTFRFTLYRTTSEKLGTLEYIPNEKLLDIETNKNERSDNNRLKYRSVSKYLSRLFSAYASLDKNQREEIIYADYYKMIKAAIENKTCLTFVNSTCRAVILKPYKIMTDVYTSSKYIVGMVQKHQGDKEYIITSMYIYKLRNLNPCNTNVPALTPAEKSNISKRLEKVSPGYISGEAKEINVRLSEEGLSLFHKILHNRPAIIKEERKPSSGAVVKVLCTEYHAYNYFKSYGCNAEILEPQQLRIKMAEFYNQAAEHYNSKY